MSKDDNTIGSWKGKPLPYDETKQQVNNVLGLVKLTQPDYFLSYLEETGVVPQGYSKLDATQRDRLAEIIQDWLADDLGHQKIDNEFLRELVGSQTSGTEEK